MYTLTVAANTVSIMFSKSNANVFSFYFVLFIYLKWDMKDVGLVLDGGLAHAEDVAEKVDVSHDLKIKRKGLCK
jgi:hypothetical protein